MLKVCLHRVEIPEEMKSDAILYADNAMDKFTIEKVMSCRGALLETQRTQDVATDLKKHFDSHYGGTWHCVVSLRIIIIFGTILQACFDCRLAQASVVPSRTRLNTLSFSNWTKHTYFCFVAKNPPWLRGVDALHLE